MAVELSDREEAVLRGIADEQTFPEIAKVLGVSYETVKTYADRLRDKLNVRTKVGLALWAKENLPCPSPHSKASPTGKSTSSG